MATGDRIMIADKGTLDSVKQNTELLLALNDDMRSTMSGVNNKIDGISSSDGDVFDNTSRAKLVYGNASTGINTPTTILNLPNSSGKLYMVLMSCKPSDVGNISNNNTVEVVIDGTIVHNPQVNLPSTASEMNMCLVDKSLIVSSEMSPRLLLANGLIVNSGSYGYGMTMYSNSSIYTPNVIAIHPIRWKTSLKITASSSRVGGIVYYYYELD